MFSDRYEIHIQAFVDFINAIAIILKSSSSQNMIQTKVLKFSKNTHENKNNGTPDFQQKTKLSKHLGSQIYKNNMFHDVPIIFLYCLKYFYILKVDFP